MSSRLFQKIREERGLAYSVYSYGTAFLEGDYLLSMLELQRKAIKSIRDY